MHIGFGPWDVAVDGLGVAGVGLGPCGLGGGGATYSRGAGINKLLGKP